MLQIAGTFSPTVIKFGSNCVLWKTSLENVTKKNMNLLSLIDDFHFGFLSFNFQAAKLDPYYSPSFLYLGHYYLKVLKDMR